MIATLPKYNDYLKLSSLKPLDEVETDVAQKILDGKRIYSVPMMGHVFSQG